MAGTSSRKSNCTTKGGRSFANPRAKAQQAHDKNRKDDAFERLRQRIQEMNHG